MFSRLSYRKNALKTYGKQTLAGSARLSKRLFKLALSAALIASALNLTACGHTGGLYLPNQTAHHTSATKGN